MTKSIIDFRVLVLVMMLGFGLVWQTAPVVAQESSAGLIERSYESVKSEVDSSEIDIQEMKRLALNYREQYSELIGFREHHLPVRYLEERSEALLNTRQSYREKRLALVNLETLIKRLLGYNLQEGGWTKAQAEQARKWKQVADRIKKELNSKGNITPDEFDVSLLIEKITGKWYQ